MLDHSTPFTENETATSLIRIIAHPVPWPEPSSPTSRLRWDARLESGELLAGATERPLSDGAYALMSLGRAPATSVTMRHAGKAFDSFVPQSLRTAAEPAAKRADKAEKTAAYFSQRRPAP